MELPVDNAVETGQQRYPVDDITQRTPCVLQCKHKGIIFTVGHGTVAPTQPGDVYHGQPIPVGYAKVGVEELCQDFETLELDIPGGDGETTLAQAIHGWILWEKRNILLKLLIRHQD
jgi:hypothetical protein